MRNVLNLEDCSLIDLKKAIKIANNLAQLTDVKDIEVYVKGTFKDKAGELIFINSWKQIIDVNSFFGKAYFTIEVDDINTLVKPATNKRMDVKINI